MILTFLYGYIIVMYVIGMVITILRLTSFGKITILDTILFVLSPFSMLSVILVMLLSNIVEVEYVIFSRDMHDNDNSK